MSRRGEQWEVVKRKGSSSSSYPASSYNGAELVNQWTRLLNEVKQENLRYKAFPDKIRRMQPAKIVDKIRDHVKEISTSSFGNAVRKHFSGAVRAAVAADQGQQGVGAEKSGRVEEDGKEEGKEGADSGAATVSPPPAVDIVCYGLGSVSKSYVSQCQFALIYWLRNCEGHGRGKLYVFEPLLLDVDRDCLSQMDVTFIAKNEEGKRAVENLTIFYLPHCSRGLSNNVLWANWGQRLKHVLVIANSFSGVLEGTRRPNNANQSNTDGATVCITVAQPITSEQAFVEYPPCIGAFNDLSLHAFDVTSYVDPKSFPPQPAEYCIPEEEEADKDPEIIPSSLKT